jgi:hypothetical protein
MPEQPKEGSDQKTKVRVALVASVDLYQIKDSELDTFEKGSPADLHLNFAIALLTLAVSAFGTLYTATFQNETAKTVYIVITIAGFMIGVFLLASWWKSHTSLKQICKKIRERMPPEAEHPPTSPPDVQPKG